MFKRLLWNNRQYRSWALYDWGNSAFAATIMAAVMPTFFADVAAKELESFQKTAYWSYINGFSVLIVALISPLLGILADRFQSKKRFLLAFTILGSASCIAMYTIGENQWMRAAVLFNLGFIGFACGEVFYESLLPHVATKNDLNRLSATGFAMGYIGGGILLAINLLMISQPAFFGIKDSTVAVQISFITVGLWWAVFSRPLFKNIPEPQLSPQARLPYGGMAKAVFQSVSQLWQTLRELRRYRQAFLFLLAFWAYSDGIGTIIKLATIYGREVGIGTSDLIGAILLVQFLGVPFSLLYGPAADQYGTKACIFFTLSVYLIITLLSYFMKHAWHFWMLAIAISMVQGGAQACSRALYASLIPKNKSAEFFGFYSTSSKFAGIFGPFIFAYISQTTESSQLGILAIATTFLAGMILLRFVNVEKGQAEALGGDHPQSA